jgi:adenosylhomocysteine nucleosidase
MEGGAVAQVCYENKIPFAIIRTISDTANEKSEIDFNSFIVNIAGKYASLMIQALLSN